MLRLTKNLRGLATNPWMIAFVIILTLICPQLWATVTASQLCTAMVGKSYPVTQGYLKYCTCNLTKDKLHAGIDYGAPDGATVRTILSGTVINVNATIGSVAVYDGYNTAFYLHMKGIKVSKGAKIQFGTPIGQVSNVNTKNVHLHIEVRRGYQMNPVGEATSGSTASNTYDPLAYF
jgi:murein DD-endopeptidase MepM/ murein hydrolase activator NlpD